MRGFALHQAFHIARLMQVEHVDTHAMSLAGLLRAYVHDLEPLVDHAVVGHVWVELGGGVFLGIGTVDAVHLRGFEQSVGLPPRPARWPCWWLRADGRCLRPTPPRDPSQDGGWPARG